MVLDRREAILSATAAGMAFALRPSAARAISFWEAVGGIGSAIFPPALAGLAGFGLVRTINTLGDVDNLVNNANAAVLETQQLVAHIDSVVSQISTTLGYVETY